MDAQVTDLMDNSINELDQVSFGSSRQSMAGADEFYDVVVQQPEAEDGPKNPELTADQDHLVYYEPESETLPIAFSSYKSVLVESK
eukprot:SAG11_NODE_1432_length_4934_cov_4.303206_3_plen_86_part_00